MDRNMPTEQKHTSPTRTTWVHGELSEGQLVARTPNLHLSLPSRKWARRSPTLFVMVSSVEWQKGERQQLDLLATYIWLFSAQAPFFTKSD